MAFAIDDVVLLTPKDKMHPTLKSNGYAQIIDTMVNGRSDLYRVAIGGVVGALYLMEEADLTAVPAGTPLGGRVTASLPAKKRGK